MNNQTNHKNYAPVALFAFNRPDHTHQTLKHLESNLGAEETPVFVFIDGPRNEKDKEKKEQILNLFEAPWKFKSIEIIESQTNKGLAKSLISGISQIFETFDTIIVLEDDLLTSKYFLDFMNNGLSKYKHEKKVMQVSGHQFLFDEKNKKNESLFLSKADSWGWGTWKRAWASFDENGTGYEELKTNLKQHKEFNIGTTDFFSNMLIQQMESSKVDSWAIRWWWTLYKAGGLTLYPDFTLVKNIGFGEESTHTKEETHKNGFDLNYKISSYPKEIELNIKKQKELKACLGEIHNVKKEPKLVTLVNKTKGFLLKTYNKAKGRNLT